MLNVLLDFLRIEAGVSEDHIRPMALQPLLRKLVFNAIRCIERGGVSVGCRSRGGAVSVQIARSAATQVKADTGQAP